MFSSHRYLLLAALVMGLAAVAGPRPAIAASTAACPPATPPSPPLRNPSGIFANPQIAPGLSLQQAAYNAAVMGNAYAQVPPYALGYNPYVGGPTLAITPGYGQPVCPLDQPELQPLHGVRGSLGTSPYSLSTTGGGDALHPSYGGYGGYGPGSPRRQLQGYASHDQRHGQVLQGHPEGGASPASRSARRTSTPSASRIELERWYEATRLKPHQLREQEMALELNSARGEAPESNVSTGRALNTLLASIQKSAQTQHRPQRRRSTTTP